MATAAVTGASGFIGAVVAARLSARGWQVRALARSAASARGLRAGGAVVVRGDLADDAALRRLTAPADALVHCAGAVRGARYRDFETVNVAGTAGLLAALGERDIPLVVLSSAAAREPGLSDYAHSKRAMEKLLERADHPARWLALRPPAVYGPGDTQMRALFQAMARGVALLPAPPSARVSLLHVDDLAAAIAAWLEAPAGRGVYEIHDGRPGGYRWQDVVAVAEGLLGRRVRRLRPPRAALAAFARANAGAARLLGYAPMLTPGKLAELRHPDWVCDNDPLQRVVAWRPELDLALGLARTYGWGRPGRTTRHDDDPSRTD